MTDSLQAQFNRRAEVLGWPMRSDPTLTFVAPLLQTALDTWREQAGRRRLAAQCAMTPRVMKSFLRHLAILDIVPASGASRYRVRIAGCELQRLLGNHDGRYIDEVVPSPFLERWEAMVKLCLDIGGPVRLSGVLEFRNQSYLNIETLFAPLAGPDRTPCAILVVAQTNARDFVHPVTLAPTPLVQSL